MCRALAYLGQPVLLDDLLYGSDNSLVSQTVAPGLMSLLNIGGFGLAAWDSASRSPDLPFTYRTPEVPVLDRNLKALARKVHATAAVAHVRGVVYDPGQRVGPQDLHPFQFPSARVVLAQNGEFHRFGEMRFDLIPHIRPDLARLIDGMNDTEWFYALVLSQLADPFGPAEPDELADAILQALAVMRDVRERHGIATQSPVNLIVSDGRSIVATRFAFDYGWYPDDDSFFAREREFDFTTLWCAPDPDGRSACIASEPLTNDRARWVEVPEYSMLVASSGHDGIELETRELAA